MAKKAKEILFVNICEAKPNKFFTEEQRRMVRFLRYNKKIECVECHKKKKTMWTMLCQFKCGNMKEKSFSLRMGESHQPLTPVCDEHPLVPDWPNNET